MIKIVPNGGNSYQMSPSPQREQPKRGTCKGWTRDVSRGNCDFLMSVETDSLTGCGFALSLTIRDCPETPQAWQDVRRRFVERLRRLGLIRLHWLTEWQRRGVPHLHAAAWFSDGVTVDALLSHWLASARAYSPGLQSQHIAPITGAPGWFEYLAKHAARSVSNYQRSSSNIPPAWGGNTGRMWGHVGEWSTSEAKLIEVPDPVEKQYRRLMLRYQIGKARRQGDHRRVMYFRRYLSRSPKDTARAQALPRLWIPENDQWSLLACAMKSHG